MPWSVSHVFVFVSTLLQVSPIFPIIPCVYLPVFSVCLSVCQLPVCLVCSSLPAFWVSAPACSSFSFLVLLVFDPCLSWPCTRPPDHCLRLTLTAVLYLCSTSGLPTSAWPEPACRPVPWPLLWILDPCLDLLFACPCCYNNHCYVTQSALGSYLDSW